MKVWITKHALSKGIEEREAQESISQDPNIITAKVDGYIQYFHGRGNDWHLSEKDAKFKAEEMRKKKIESLQKQISKLEKMRFE